MNYIIREENVFVPATKWFEERPIGELKEANQQYTIASMEERFNELIEKVNEIKTEFDATEDKIKIAGKVSRTKSYLCNAKAIGDYASLLEQLDVMEEEIQKAVEATLAKKEEIVKNAEELLTATNNKEATEKLRQLQQEFKSLPIVPDLKNEELRERFEKLKDDFFKGKQASYENFEHELLDNLSKKIDLCEKAEKLSNSGEWKKTTDLYIALNEEWKKIGMVPKHRLEEIWFRFCAAKDIFFARKKEHIGDIIVEQEENLIKKQELVAKAEELKESTAWTKTSEAYADLMEQWKKTGRVTAEKSDEIWNQFLEAKNHFYKNKDAHYSTIRVQLDDNLAKKMAIVTHAEELQNSNDFDNATNEFLEMFEEWKKIGRVAKEHGDEAWERFMKAKRSFFERKDAARDERRKEMHKDVAERLTRNRGFYNKVSRELQNEEELLLDVHERMNNLPASLRSYEKREEYLVMIEDIKKKVNELKAKCQDVKDKMQQDERIMGGGHFRGPRKPHPDNKSDEFAKQQPKTSKENDETATQKEIIKETKEQPEIEISAEEALAKLMNKYKK